MNTPRFCQIVVSLSVCFWNGMVDCVTWTETFFLALGGFIFSLNLNRCYVLTMLALLWYSIRVTCVSYNLIALLTKETEQCLQLQPFLFRLTMVSILLWEHFSIDVPLFLLLQSFSTSFTFWRPWSELVNEYIVEPVQMMRCWFIF